MTRAALLFDFFGVICCEIAPAWLARHLTDKEALEVKATIVDAADRGALPQDGLFSVLESMTGVPARTIESEWLAAGVADAAVIDIIANASRNYALGILSNTPSRFFWTLFRRFGLETHFGTVVVSSEHGCAKPDKRIYDIAADALGTRASDILMIDDNPRNVAGAQQAGLQAVLFENAEQLTQYLGATPRSS